MSLGQMTIGTCFNKALCLAVHLCEAMELVWRRRNVHSPSLIEDKMAVQLDRNNIENFLSTDYVRDCVLPWLKFVSNV